MKLVFAFVVLALATTSASAQRAYHYGRYGSGSNPQSHYVQPQFKADGSFTEGHFRTNPNATDYDNFGTRGNINPYTGTVGTRSPHW